MNEGEYMDRAIELAVRNVAEGGGPFAAIVVRGAQVVGEGANRVTALNDPTAHAEIVAIRSACERLGSFELRGCELFTTCEPCPMCLSAAYWARLDRIFYASAREDAAAAGFDDEHIYEELGLDLDERRLPMIRIRPTRSGDEFAAWKALDGRTPY